MVQASIYVPFYKQMPDVCLNGNWMAIHSFSTFGERCIMLKLDLKLNGNKLYLLFSFYVKNPLKRAYSQPPSLSRQRQVHTDLLAGSVRCNSMDRNGNAFEGAHIVFISNTPYIHQFHILNEALYICFMQVVEMPIQYVI